MAWAGPDTLQWGRGVSAAEIWRRAYAGQVADQLQWGRGVSAAEMGCCLFFSSSSMTRFNGAAAFQPRK
ncbi:protein of unknown function [Candidatus Nitrospira inopinata]|uniref:Uncharacterized protein n=1 Tax=Candidatus Nitrospira inopinata TaxID=1715989 RepID=A0A0S4KUL1_9BACT|nr:protein of unknown function [Candidatus Nitrospira inopinata]